MEIGSQNGGLGPTLLGLLHHGGTQNGQSAGLSSGQRAATDPAPSENRVLGTDAARAAGESGRTFPRGSFLDITA